MNLLWGTYGIQVGPWFQKAKQDAKLTIIPFTTAKSNVATNLPLSSSPVHNMSESDMIALTDVKAGVPAYVNGIELTTPAHLSDFRRFQVLTSSTSSLSCILLWQNYVRTHVNCLIVLCCLLHIAGRGPALFAACMVCPGVIKNVCMVSFFQVLYDQGGVYLDTDHILVR